MEIIKYKCKVYHEIINTDNVYEIHILMLANNFGAPIIIHDSHRLTCLDNRELGCKNIDPIHGIGALCNKISFLNRHLSPQIIKIDLFTKNAIEFYTMPNCNDEPINFSDYIKDIEFFPCELVRRFFFSIFQK